MKKLILASVSGIALMGLAACSDTDGTTTQAVPTEQEAPMAQPDTTPAPPPAAPVD
jgi:type IV pilus biogenesis protein CpaD/CtpE